MINEDEMIEVLKEKLQLMTVDEKFEYLINKGIISFREIVEYKNSKQTDIELFKKETKDYIDKLEQLPLEEARKKAHEDLIKIGVLNEDGTRPTISSDDENLRGFLSGFGVEDIDREINELIKKEKQIVKKRNSVR